MIMSGRQYGFYYNGVEYPYLLFVDKLREDYRNLASATEKQHPDKNEPDKGSSDNAEKEPPQITRYDSEVQLEFLSESPRIAIAAKDLSISQIYCLKQPLESDGKDSAQDSAKSSVSGTSSDSAKSSDSTKESQNDYPKWVAVDVGEPTADFELSVEAFKSACSNAEKWSLGRKELKQNTLPALSFLTTQAARFAFITTAVQYLMANPQHKLEWSALKVMMNAWPTGFEDKDKIVPMPVTTNESMEYAKKQNLKELEKAIQEVEAWGKGKAV